ncbi:hypothetical protein [Streptomyces sp. NBC_01197]|uniref:hypothetical protein n=1 Tax=Streptomyces sp. NBC_01197 TaxID=2903768 RepID=UPI002E11B296|nr:phage major capsid protein [Streptomyces sp. NBC_01197]
MALYTQSGNNTGAGQLQTTTGHFIPEIWTAQLLQDIEENLVLSGSPFTNRNYEGEFRREGDVIRIPHFVDGTVSDKGLVKAYGEIGDPDHAQLEYMKMTVAKGSSFHLEIDALHQLQTKSGIDLMSNLVAQRARASALAIDELVALTLIAGLSGKDLNGAADRNATVSGLPALELGAISTVQAAQVNAPATATLSVYDYIVKMLETLDTRSAPQDRWLFVSPRMRSLLLRDPLFIDASQHGGGGSVVASGQIGSILGLPVVVANALGNHTRPSSPVIRKGNQKFESVDLFMGSTSAVSVVMPFAQMETYKPEKSFTDAVKSRVIYDAKVCRPEQLLIAQGVEAEIVTHNTPAGTP